MMSIEILVGKYMRATVAIGVGVLLTLRNKKKKIRKNLIITVNFGQDINSIKKTVVLNGWVNTIQE